MSKDSEVLHAFIDSGAIVDSEKAAHQPVRRSVDEDDRDLIGSKLLEKEVFDAEGHNGYAVDLAFQHATCALHHPRALVTGRSDQDLVSMINGHFFELANQFREEGVGDLRDDQTEELALAGDKGTGLRIWEILELSGNSPDTFGQTRLRPAYPA